MRALVLNAETRTAELQYVSLPVQAPNELLVKVEAISLNPIDPLYVLHPLASSGRKIGSDFAGLVVDVGASVPNSAHFKKGVRIAGFLQGACSVNERAGAFSEFLTVPWDLVWIIPNGVSTNEAASVSLVALTAAQAIWYRLQLKAPFHYEPKLALEEHPEWNQGNAFNEQDPKVVNFFIYGASTSVGLYAAQMVRLTAKASGMTIRLFGAASKARWEMLRAQPYAYDYLVDYRDTNWSEQVKKLADDSEIHYAYDCIAEGDTVQRIASTLTRGGKSAIVRSREGGTWKADDLSVEPIYGAVWEGLGEEVQYQGFTVKQSPAARGFSVAFYEWLSVAMGLELKPTPVRLMPGGLEKVVEDGFQLLGAGGMKDRKAKRPEEWMRPVSAEKLVYRV
ncbi:GroES-like protein [Cucurbitaria berberidis CBS 394.84]|uniref:GroES-like protein n=1 Tax=Cucurbitaria berberidis CBS 394.84 TaxID=1168544 RepID=A0A9P4GC46_9PLEO|nr:GroES-like protein [Cucurbitaria berberidis CBS 394.84]KAF1842821.1 GroES-like protein [Cucurbitaria berberidis CBS 394.84]